ncbi:MAG: ABC transporter permease, partial [Candidatus Thermoplasmatota archaeon]
MKGKILRTWNFMKSHFINRVRTKKFLVWVVITPMLLIGFLNLIGGGEQEIKASVAVVDKDNTFISNTTVNLLRNEDRLEINEVIELEGGIDLLKNGDVEAVLVIPKDFSEKWEKIGNNSEDYETITFKVYHASGEQEELISKVLKGVTAEV